MRLVKNIDELYSEVRNHDVVICNDAPLATALNNRVDKPRLGTFAVTPRHLASKEAVGILGEGIWNDLRIISRISGETGYEMKFVHGEIENIRTIRRYTKDVEKHLHSRSSRRIYRSFSELPTIEKVMDEYDPEMTGLFSNKKVAVIGLDFFDDLDKHFVPKAHDEISIFKRGTFTIDKIYELGNDRQIADNAVDMISAENASDVAVVMDVSGPIADAVRSSLYRKGIPFKNALSVKDLSQIRDYLEFITLALSFDTLRVRHVRELFSLFRGMIPHRYDEYFLSVNMNYMTNERSRQLGEIMKNIRERTFKDVCDLIFDEDSFIRKRYRQQVYLLLEDLGLEDKLVTDALVNSMTYAVNNISDLRHNEEIPEEEKQGVLLIDCNRSVYIDRPFVIYLGMGYEWSGIDTGRDYIDWEDEKDKNTNKFQALLQQGSFRMYIVNSMRSGKPARPCLLFDHAYGEPKKTFRSVCDQIMKGSWSRSTEITKEKIAIDTKAASKLFTKTSLSNYIACPLQFMFSELAGVFTDDENRLFGTVIHEFAEFCACYPEIVEKNGIDMYSDMIAERFAGLACPELKEIDKSDIRVALKNLRSFLSLVPKIPLDTIPEDRHGRNMFFEYHSLNRSSSQIETISESKNSRLYGIIDLVFDGKIFDYKTGRPKSLKDIKNDMDETAKNDFFDFQPLVYLALLDDNVPEGDKEFNTVFLLDNASEAASDPAFDIRHNIRRTTLVNTTAEEFIRTELKDIITEKYPEMAAVWSFFSDMLIRIGPVNTEGWDADEDLETALRSRKITKARKIIRYAVEVMSGRAIFSDDQLIITKDMLDDFRSFIKDKHKEMTERRNTSFPAAATKRRCEYCQFRSICMAAPEEEEGSDE